MKRFKTIICICLILIVASSMAIVIGRYAVSKNVTESSSEMQLAESKKDADEVAANYGNIGATWDPIFNILRITYTRDNDFYITTIPDEYKSWVSHIIIENYAYGTIKKDAFKECPNLKTVYIKSYGIERIEEGAFWGNKNLETVILDNNVNYIGKAAFAECPNLTKVIIQGYNKYLTMEDNSFGKGKTRIYCKPLSSAYDCATSYGFNVVADGNSPEDCYITKKRGSNGWTSGEIVFEYGG